MPSEKCYPLTLIDAYSRYLLRCEGVIDPDGNRVQRASSIRRFANSACRRRFARTRSAVRLGRAGGLSVSRRLQRGASARGAWTKAASDSVPALAPLLSAPQYAGRRARVLPSCSRRSQRIDSLATAYDPHLARARLRKHRSSRSTADAGRSATARSSSAPLTTTAPSAASSARSSPTPRSRSRGCVATSIVDRTRRPIRDRSPKSLRRISCGASTSRATSTRSTARRYIRSPSPAHLAARRYAARWCSSPARPRWARSWSRPSRVRQKRLHQGQA
jgi:hypothetical protein